MSISQFISRQIFPLCQDDLWLTIARNIGRVLIRIVTRLPLFILALPILLVIRLLKPWFLIRIGCLTGQRIGHFAANTELYLCQRDAGINVPKQPYLDLFYISEPVCNQQLATMWKRILIILPYWLLAPIARINRLIPGGMPHDALGANDSALDIYNLLDKFPSHLKFTEEEQKRGENGLRELGIPVEEPYVCLIVRDSAYLDFHLPGDWSYHSYRDSNIENYVVAAESLAERGYYVIRMGAKVNRPLISNNKRVIDYANNGLRDEFMDVFLCATCDFCISTGAGLDAISEMMRKPIVYVNLVPLGYLHTFGKYFLSISKWHLFKESRKILTLSEIFSHEVGFCMSADEYISKGVELLENTPEEIRDVVIEMAERLNGSWKSYEGDEVLQSQFWDIFPSDAVDINGKPLHGEIRGRFGTVFLRQHPEWLQ